MDKKCSSSKDFTNNVRHLPHVDPPITTPTSQVRVKKPKAKFRALEKVITPDSNANSINIKENKAGGDGACQDDSNIEGASNKRLAKACLYEICAANDWKPPSFECCKEEGPSHMKMFTFKVIVEIEDASNMVLECFGAPRSKKKTAAEHAAEGALWCEANFLLSGSQFHCGSVG